MNSHASDILVNSNVGYNIDLDREFKAMIMGEWGCWGVLRIFDLNTRSRWWHPDSQEAINGPAYAFTDYLIRMRRVYQMGARSDANMSTTAGMVGSYADVFYIASNVRPKKEDLIFEVAEAEWSNPPSNVHVLRQYKIERPDQLLDAKLIYSKVYTYYKAPVHDESIVFPLVIDQRFVRTLYT